SPERSGTCQLRLRSSSSQRSALEGHHIAPADVRSLFAAVRFGVSNLRRHAAGETEVNRRLPGGRRRDALELRLYGQVYSAGSPLSPSSQLRALSRPRSRNPAARHSSSLIDRTSRGRLG